MLSIVTRGNGTSAQAYYEHLIDGRDREIEDYYAKREKGRWLGRGADALGLSGPVRKEAFQDLAFGFDPKTGNPLVQNPGNNHRSGWDLTFSAPKSVSLVWALGDDETRERITAAHDRAVETALSYMERHASFCRKGHGGREEVRADFVVATYRHYTSREQDPQLHSHGFVFNVAMGEDGKTRTLEGSHFFEWKMAGGAAYRVALAKELQKQSYTVLRDGKSFRLGEIDRELEDLFSTRRRQIEAALSERGVRGAKASEVATLTTRKSKQERDPEELRTEWRERARRYLESGIIRECKRTLEQDLSRKIEHGLESRRSLELLPESLTQERSTFTEAQAHARILQELQGMKDLSVAEGSVDAILSGPEIVPLVSKPGRDRYTTLEMQRIEREMVEKALDLGKRLSHPVRQKSLEEILSESGLSTEQKTMVRSVTRETSLVAVQGWAGTGKSTALKTAREIWEKNGFRVRGAALSGKAALGLSEGSGIVSKTLAALEREIGEDGTLPLTSRDVLVVDEAGMVGSRTMERILSKVNESGAKLVLVGDVRQLPSIEAGAAFRAILERVGSSELSHIRRQTLDEDRQAIRDLALGKAEKALENLSERNRIHAYDSGRLTKEGIGEAVSRDLFEGKLSIAVSAAREEARDINEWARIHAQAMGLSDKKGIRVATVHGEREFSQGDRILCTRNDRRLGVMNGDFGTVREIRNGQIRIELDRGGFREVDPFAYAHLDYGYAATCHKLQGATVDRCHIYAPENGMSGREWAYVAASRARESFHIHAERLTLQELAPSWSASRAKDTTLDYEGDKRHERGLQEDLRTSRRTLSTAEDFIRRLDETLGHPGTRRGIRRALSLRYLERAHQKDRSLDRDRAEKELVIETPLPERKSRKKERELSSPERGLGL